MVETFLDPLAELPKCQLIDERPRFVQVRSKTWKKRR